MGVYERGSTLVTSNLPSMSVGSERLTGALLDRLTPHILEMNGESYRLKRSRENAEAQALEKPGRRKTHHQRCPFLLL